MTDLETLFRPLVDEAAAFREPVGVIETRARQRHSRERRRHVQLRLAASFVVVALVAATVGFVQTRHDSGPARAVATTAPPATDTGPIVPPGWVSYDYGLARISVPPDYTAVSGNGCGAAAGPLLELQSAEDVDGPVCGGGPVVQLGPLNEPAGTRPPFTSSTVNGIEYLSVPEHCAAAPPPPSTLPPTASDCVPTIWVPKLGITIFFSFSLGDRVADIPAIIDTLTYSTYARVLQQPFAAAPASWRTITFGGYSVRVPRSWPVVDLSKTGFCYPAPNTAYVGTPSRVYNCAPPSPVTHSPEASLQLEQDDARGPLTSSAPSSIAWQHNGLRFAQEAGSAFTPLSHELFLTIDGPSGRLLLTLGLGLDPAVASAGILGSVTAIGS